MEKYMIVFDIDGTMWDVTNCVLESAIYISKKYNEIPITKERIYASMGLSMYESSKLYFPNVNEEKRLKYFNELVDYNNFLIREKGGTLYPNLENVIKKLNVRYDMGIITSNNNEYVNLFLDFSKLKNYFLDYIGAESYKISKKECMKKMIDKYNLDNIIYIGDTLSDMNACLELNIPFIWASYGFGKNLNVKYKIASIDGLENVINNVLSELKL